MFDTTSRYSALEDDAESEFTPTERNDAEVNKVDSWWSRVGNVVLKLISPANAAALVSGIVVNVIGYFSNRTEATNPAHYGITPEHLPDIQACFDANMPRAASYEALRMLFQIDPLSLEIPVWCCVALSVIDVAADIRERHKESLEVIALKKSKTRKNDILVGMIATHYLQDLR